MRIGELLIMNGLLTEEQLEQTLKEQLFSRKKIGQILVGNGIITERQLVEALEFQLGIPALNMMDTVFDSAAVFLIDETIASKFTVIPIQQKDRKIKVAMADPLNAEAILEIQMATGMRVQPFLATNEEIVRAIQENYDVTESAEELNEILRSALRDRVKEIHLEPGEKEWTVKFRDKQLMKTYKRISSPLRELILRRIRTLANLPFHEQGLPQEGRLNVVIEDKPVLFQVSILPTVKGESVVLLMMEDEEAVKGFNDLEWSEANLDKVEKTLQKHKGLFLISAPPHNGKATALYALIKHIHKEEMKTITLEDPVQQHIEGIMQVAVQERSGFTFMLHAVMRHNPDMVMISELRDAETVRLATRLALSDKLVLGAVEGNNSLTTINQLIERGADRYLLVSSLSCVVSQRLVRKICKQCAQAVPVTDEELNIFETHHLHQSEDKNSSKGLIGNFRTFVTAQISGKMTVTRGIGCRLCNETGFRGEAAIQEVIVMDETLRELFIKQSSMKEIEDYLQKNGFKSMLYDGLTKVKEGVTTVKEVLSVLG